MTRVFASRPSPSSDAAPVFGDQEDLARDGAPAFGAHIHRPSRKTGVFGGSDDCPSEIRCVFGGRIDFASETTSVFGARVDLASEPTPVFGGRVDLPSDTGTDFGGARDRESESLPVFGGRHELPADAERVFGGLSELPLDLISGGGACVARRLETPRKSTPRKILHPTWRLRGSRSDYVHEGRGTGLPRPVGELRPDGRSGDDGVARMVRVDAVGRVRPVRMEIHVMSNSNPNNTPTSNVFNLVAANSAVAATALPIDGARAELSFDPEIGEAALLSCKDALLGIDPTQVSPPNLDCSYAAIASMALVIHLESAKIAAAFAKMPSEFMGDATPALLRTLAQTLFYLETRTRTKEATTSGVRVDVALITQGTEVRERMLRVLTYYFQDDALMTAELADIRSGQGYVDLASDLARLATHYTQHASALADDRKHYDPQDQVLARGISKEILSALQRGADESIVDLRNRAFTKLARVYSRLKAAGDFIFSESQLELAMFPALRHAVVSQTSRSQRSADPAPPEPVSPVSPNAPVSPVVSPVAPPFGTGPGGSPLL